VATEGSLLVEEKQSHDGRTRIRTKYVINARKEEKKLSTVMIQKWKKNLFKNDFT